MRYPTRLLTTLAILLAVGRAEELSLGSSIPMPELKMPDVSGKAMSFQDVMGSEGMVVIFSCNTCPWVHRWEGRYVELASAFTPRGVGFVAVNSNEAFRTQGDSFADMQARAKAKGYNFYYTLDEASRLAREFGATRTPHVFVFNAEGQLVYRGAVDDNAHEPDKVDEAYLADALDALLAGEPIKKAATKALGCTIKFGK